MKTGWLFEGKNKIAGHALDTKLIPAGRQSWQRVGGEPCSSHRARGGTEVMEMNSTSEFSLNKSQRMKYRWVGFGSQHPKHRNKHKKIFSENNFLEIDKVDAPKCYHKNVQ